MTTNNLSPGDLQYGGSAYGSAESENGTSALSMSLDFLKNLTEKKNTRGKIFNYMYSSNILLILDSRWPTTEAKGP